VRRPAEVIVGEEAVIVLHLAVEDLNARIGERRLKDSAVHVGRQPVEAVSAFARRRPALFEFRRRLSRLHSFGG